MSGPAEVEQGTTQIAYTAVVTDAFGNPVAGFTRNNLNVQVSGPAFYQDGGTQTNDAGQIQLNVRVDNDADGVVSIQVQGLSFPQFGAAKDRVNKADDTDTGKDLTASSDVANASTTVKGAPVAPEKLESGLVARGANNGARNDKVVARAIDETAGAEVKLFKRTRNGLKLLRTGFMNSKGNFKFRDIKDRNGKKRTAYVVVVAETDSTTQGRGGRKIR